MAVKDDPDPPRKVYTLKAREIERLNPVPGGTSSSKAGGAPGPSAVAGDPGRKAGSAPTIPSTMLDATDVRALAQATALAERKAGLHDTALNRPRYRSRRKRDYLFTLCVGNGLLFALLGFTGLNAATAIFGLAGFVIFNLAVTWVIWFVMDDY